MIVRCKGCDSAFAVDDAKITNKKFAFTCPKCATENIIDNRASAEEGARPSSAIPVAGVAAAGAGAAAAGAALYSKTPESKSTVKPSDDMDFNLPDENALIDDMDFSIPDEKPSTAKESMDFSETALPSENDELTIPDLEEAGDLPEFDDSSLNDIDNLDLDFDSASTESEKFETASDSEEDQEEFVSFDDSGEVEASGKNKDLDLPEIDKLGTDSTLPVMDELDDFADLPVYDDKAADLEFDSSSNLEEISLDEKKLSSGIESSEITDDFLPIDDDILSESGSVKNKEDNEFEDFDIPEVIESDQNDGIKSEDIYKKTGSDDDITIDLDNLDIELEDDVDAPISSEAPEVTASAVSEDSTETLDLESLDIDLDDGGSVLSGEEVVDDFVSFDDENMDQKFADKDSLNDETLDLDSLDIPLEETGEFKKGEELDDDDKLTLTLDDAGLTMDELSMASVDENASSEEDEDELRLTIDEVDPSLGMIDNLEQDLREAESVLSRTSVAEALLTGSGKSSLSGKTDSAESKLMFDEIDDLPEIDLDDELTDFKFQEDEFDKRIISLDSDDSIGLSRTSSAMAGAGALGAAAVAAGIAAKNRRKNDALDLKDDSISKGVFDLKEDSEYDDNLLSGKKERNIDYKGSVVFSIDYSLYYSKIGALIRLFFIYLIGLLPHYLVVLLYSALSFILGFINNLVVISTGEAVEDFSEVQENTLRYILSIGASSIGLVEENPIFSGRKNIDYPLQLDITYPIRSSRFMGMVRASFIGIIILSIPHILISIILTMIVPIASFIGQISVLFTGKWPRILFEFLTSYFRYQARVFSYVIGLIDEYPPFKF